MLSESALQTATANTGQVFECWAASSLAADAAETNQQHQVDNDVISSRLN